MVVASVALFVVFVLAITNFDALLGTLPGDALNWALPAGRRCCGRGSGLRAGAPQRTT